MEYPNGRPTRRSRANRPPGLCGRRHLDAVGVAIAIVLSVGSSALADLGQFSVNTAAVETVTGGGSVGTLLTDGGVNQLNGASGAGHLFMNNTDTNLLHLAGGDTHIVAVGSSIMSVLNFQDGGLTPARYNGEPVVMVSALKGTVGGNPTIFSASSGRVGLFSASAYNPLDPATWGATNAAGTALLTPIAVWDLAPPADILDLGIGVPGYGGPGTFTTPAARVNNLVRNAIISNDSQGRSLFRETQDSTFASTSGALSGNAFITVIGNPVLPAAMWEGIAMETHQSLATSTHSPIALASDRFIDPANGGARFAALNTIAATLGGLPDLGGPGTAFATGYDWNNSAGPGTSFNPTGPNNPPNTSDGFFTLGFFMSPGELVARRRH